jgi:hypothetical protein
MVELYCAHALNTTPPSPLMEREPEGEVRKRFVSLSMVKKHN